MELKTDTGVWGAWVFFTGKEKKSMQQTIVFNSGGEKKIKSGMILASQKKEN